MKSALDRIMEISRTLQGVVGGIDFIIDRDSLTDREKVEHIRQVLRVHHEHNRQPLCAICKMSLMACDETINAEGDPIHRDCAL